MIFQPLRIRTLIKAIPRDRQTMMFSSSDEVCDGSARCRRKNMKKLGSYSQKMGHLWESTQFTPSSSSFELGKWQDSDGEHCTFHGENDDKPWDSTGFHISRQASLCVMKAGISWSARYGGENRHPGFVWICWFWWGSNILIPYLMFNMYEIYIYIYVIEDMYRLYIYPLCVV